MGKGQILQTGVNYSRYSKSISAGFTEPYLFDKNILLGGEVYYRDYNAFNYDANGDRNTTMVTRRSAVLSGSASRSPNMSPSARATRWSGRHYARRGRVLHRSGRRRPAALGLQPTHCWPIPVQELGKKLTSAIGYTAAYDNTNGIRATGVTASSSARTSPGWAVTSNISVPAWTGPNTGACPPASPCRPMRRRLHPPAAGCG
jgi:outer membrane protein insertion porin family